jgi:hypothetical protein
MPNTFGRKASRNIGTSLTAIGSYTVGASTTTTIIGLSVANISGSTVEIDVTHNDGSNDTYLIKGAPVLPGASLVLVGGDQKLVMITNDSVKVKSNTASSVDAFMSILELT